MSLLMLIISFVTSGVSAVASKALIEMGLKEYRDVFQLAFYAAGIILGFGVLLILRQRSNPKDSRFGLVMGMFSSLSFVLFLVLLTQTTGIIAFPMRGIGSLVLTAIISIIAWKEKLSRSQWVAIILSLIAMWLIY